MKKILVLLLALLLPITSALAEFPLTTTGEPVDELEFRHFGFEVPDLFLKGSFFPLQGVALLRELCAKTRQPFVVVDQQPYAGFDVRYHTLFGHRSGERNVSLFKGTKKR